MTESAAVLTQFLLSENVILRHRSDAESAFLPFPTMVHPVRRFKLGEGRVDKGARNLLRLAERVDPERMGEPAVLEVIVSSGYGYTRKDGVSVIPLEAWVGGTFAESSCGAQFSTPSHQSLHHNQEGTIASRLHSQSCPECKIRVHQFLERIYGTCVRGHRFGWRTGLVSYAGTPIGSTLHSVAQVLAGHREFGIDTFVRSQVVAGCDYWVPDPGFIVEFDERQHFTSPRKLALAMYADRHALGFSAERWMELCEQHDARDINPPYRDEQRAWYDTLRDLVPLVEGLKPTVRLYVRDHVGARSTRTVAKTSSVSPT